MRSLIHMPVKLAIVFLLPFSFLASEAHLSPAVAIDIDLSMEQAKAAMEDGRESMQKAEKVEEVAEIMKAAERSNSSWHRS